LRIREAKAWLRHLPLRFPFRFGKAWMTELPVATLRLEVEGAGGQLGVGWAASGLPPMWFDKRDGRSLPENVSDLLLSIREAAQASLNAGWDSPFDLHRNLQTATRSSLAGRPDPMPPLAAGFGPALCEAAMVDAVCRRHGQPLHQVLKRDLLGLGSAPTEWPAQPSPRMALRHTVGMADPLRDEDMAGVARCNDGLPQTLTEVIRHYGPKYFKIKIGGGDEATVKRLIALSACLGSEAGDYRLTLDGNEQWDDLGGFLNLWERLEGEPALEDFLKRILYVEQPVRRERSLAAGDEGVMAKLKAKIPLLIDESDGEAGVAEAAFELGYAGVSVKLCKGLFRALHHFRLVAELRRQGRTAFLSSEDLTAVPALPLQQDLGLAAALGLTHTERNGHHFARGGLYLTPREAEDALRVFPSLYGRGPENEPALKVDGGAIDLTQVNAHGFGGPVLPDTHHQSTLFSLST